MQELNHPNVLLPSEVVVQAEEMGLFTIYELCLFDLGTVIRKLKEQQLVMPMPNVKSIMWQILNGCLFLHSNYLMHRDLSSQNVLINPFRSNPLEQVMIADLGLMRVFAAPLQKHYETDQMVVSLFYRAPEVLLKVQHMTRAIDLWSVGCLFAELLIGRVLFRGEVILDDSKTQEKPDVLQIHQWREIITIAGAPSEELTGKWRRLSFGAQACEDAILFWEHGGKRGRRTPALNALCQDKEDPEGIRLLLEGMLTIDPVLRMSAKAALQSNWFRQKDFRQVHPLVDHIPYLPLGKYEPVGLEPSDLERFGSNSGCREEVVDHLSEVLTARWKHAYSQRRNGGSIQQPAQQPVTSQPVPVQAKVHSRIAERYHR
jgi:cyclin-dependent kinase 8/11